MFAEFKADVPFKVVFSKTSRLDGVYVKKFCF